MIALKDNLPLVRHGKDYTTGFEDVWLRNSLISAAKRAGYENWWLAEHVTQSVKSFLDAHYEGTVVSTNRLHKAVRSVLQVIGYGEVAEHFAPPPPPVVVPLSEIADRAGSGFDLVFFQMLDVRIRQLRGDRVENVRFCGLHYAVKQLRSAKRWKRSCNLLQEEIVCFIRTRMTKESGRVPLAFSLC